MYNTNDKSQTATYISFESVDVLIYYNKLNADYNYYIVYACRGCNDQAFI